MFKPKEVKTNKPGPDPSTPTRSLSRSKAMKENIELIYRNEKRVKEMSMAGLNQLSNVSGNNLSQIFNATKSKYREMRTLSNLNCEMLLSVHAKNRKNIAEEATYTCRYSAKEEDALMEGLGEDIELEM